MVRYIVIAVLLFTIFWGIINDIPEAIKKDYTEINEVING